VNKSKIFKIAIPVILTLGFSMNASASNAEVDPGWISSYVDAPAVQASYVDGTVMNFNEGCPTLWPGIGTTDIPCVSSGVDTFGGATTEEAVPTRGGVGTSYATVTGMTMTLTLDEPQTYFGLWWSAGNGSNYLNFYSDDQLVGSFSCDTIIAALNSQTLSSGGGTQYTVQDYFGNPRDGSNGGEPYAYLHVFASSGKTFNKVVFSGDGFEFDNVTVAKGKNDTGVNLVHIDGPDPEPTLTPTPTPTPTVTETVDLAETGGSDNSLPLTFFAFALISVGTVALRVSKSKTKK
jgi:hypothetical protein